MQVPSTVGGTLTPETQAKLVEQVSFVLSGNVSFGSTTANDDGEQNIEGWKAAGTSDAMADTEFPVVHGLNRVPLGFIVLQLDKAAIIYGTPALGTAWSTTTVYLKANAASVAYVIFIV